MNMPPLHSSLHLRMITTKYVHLIHLGKVFMYSNTTIITMQELKRLLAQGANPNEVEPGSKSSLLHLACEEGWKDVVELLIQHKADVNLRDGSENPPLIIACGSKSGNHEIVEMLLKK